MMINFKALYEMIFSSFDVSADTKLVEEFERDGVEKIMIIKRSWIFGLFISWMFLFIFVLMVANSYLIFLNFSNELMVAYILVGFLAFNIIYWIVSVIIYFKKFKKIYGDMHKIVDIGSLKLELVEGDAAFTKFFNQTIFNYFILIGVAIYIVYDIVFMQGLVNFGYGISNIVLLIIQIVMSSRFKKRMCDLEMDFSLIIPGKIIFYNQSGILRSIITINSDKVKTITSNFAHFIGSVFNYGDIVVLTEGDAANIGEMRLSFISHPTEIVHEINELLGVESKENPNITK
ncbi:MAG: hypothetical protein PHS92_04770 [Candidatus Gracilibacteria bacterium]|nr:hypothetical protein [Candidatus Gracilibacteria bacterium]